MQTPFLLVHAGHCSWQLKTAAAVAANVLYPWHASRPAFAAEVAGFVSFWAHWTG